MPRTRKDYKKLSSLEKDAVILAYAHVDVYKTVGESLNISTTTVQRIVTTPQAKAKIKVHREAVNGIVNTRFQDNLDGLTSVLAKGLIKMDRMIDGEYGRASDVRKYGLFDSKGSLRVPLRDITNAVKTSADILYKLKDIDLKTHELELKREQVRLDRSRLEIQQNKENRDVAFSNRTSTFEGFEVVVKKTTRNIEDIRAESEAVANGKPE